MRTIVAAIVVIVVSAPARAQVPNGEIRGVISSARGPVACVEVRVKNVDTGDVKVTTTSPAGEYTVAVAAGTYDIFAAQVGYAALARRQLRVARGTPVVASRWLGA